MVLRIFFICTRVIFLPEDSARIIRCAVLCLVALLCPTLSDPIDCSPLSSSVHGNTPGKNTRVGYHALLQGIFPTQGLSPGLLHSRQIPYVLSHPRSPRILEWAAYPFSRWSSQPRNRTRVSCVADGFFTSWATGKPLLEIKRAAISLCQIKFTDCNSSHQIFFHSFTQ